MASLQRRGFLQAASVASLTSGFSAASFATRIPGDPWIHAQAIIGRRSRPLTFRKQDFVVTEFGARHCSWEKAQAFVPHDDQDGLDTHARLVGRLRGLRQPSPSACTTWRG